jgi:hypothetical protein
MPRPRLRSPLSLPSALARLVNLHFPDFFSFLFFFTPPATKTLLTATSLAPSAHYHNEIVFALSAEDTSTHFWAPGFEGSFLTLKRKRESDEVTCTVQEDERLTED